MQLRWECDCLGYEIPVWPYYRTNPDLINNKLARRFHFPHL